MSCDVKSLSLHHYGQNIYIYFTETSNSKKELGESVYGKLKGRTWGKSLIDGHLKDDVIALTLELDGEEREIPCIDILCVSEISVTHDSPKQNQFL